MQLDELLATAKRLRGSTLADGIIDVLGEDPPCGFDPPLQCEVGDGRYLLIDEKLTSKAEARAYAAMIIRAADEHWADEAPL